MSHAHNRREDEPGSTLSDSEKVDGLYKIGKILVMVFAAGTFGLALRDKIAEIPRNTSRIAAVENDLTSVKEQMAYLVGGMEGLTGKKFRKGGPRRMGGE